MVSKLLLAPRLTQIEHSSENVLDKVSDALTFLTHSHIESMLLTCVCVCAVEFVELAKMKNDTFSGSIDDLVRVHRVPKLDFPATHEPTARRGITGMDRHQTWPTATKGNKSMAVVYFRPKH